MSEGEMENDILESEVQDTSVTEVPENVQPIEIEEKEQPAKSFEEALERNIKDRDVKTEAVTTESPEDLAAKEAATIKREVKSNLPPSWSKNLATKWDVLPEEVKAEIARREEEVTRGFSRDGEDKKMAREFKDMFSEYEKQGINFPRGYKETVKDLLGAAKVLNFGSPQEKLDFMDRTAKSVGLDLRVALDVNNNNQQAQENNLPNSEVYALKQQLAHLEGAVKQQFEIQDQMHTKEASEIINTFASDPAHKYYHQVAPQMGQLIQMGLAGSLEDAYEKAISLDQELNSMRIEEARRDAIAKFRERTSSQTNAAKMAAVSLTGTAPTISARKASSFEEALSRNLGV
jgi:hypothetical protein